VLVLENMEKIEDENRERDAPPERTKSGCLERFK